MDARVPMAARDEVPAAWVATLLQQRQTILPKRLHAPGPDAAQLEQILAAAASAPDHGQLLPWRFVLVPQAARGALADVFERSLAARDPLATAAQREQAREKAFRAPLLLLAVGRLQDDATEVPAAERLLSAGCAIQNLLLMATALGFGSALTSGKAMTSAPMRELFSLAAGEQALCFVSIGTPASRKPPRPRPALSAYVSTLDVAAAGRPSPALDPRQAPRAPDS